MDDVVTWCFVASIAMSIISAIMPSGDFAGSIFAFMFWISGWVIAWGADSIWLVNDYQRWQLKNLNR